MTQQNLHLSTLERHFINTFQGGFPLNERPFEVAAQQLECSEITLIEVIKNLKEKKILTRFGPLYDAERLGGGLTLAAISVPEERFEMVSKQVNSFPEVAHNYRREHKLNMWFVLATETPIELMQVISAIEELTGLSVYNFPKQHEFYIGLWFKILESGYHETIPVPNKVSTKLAGTENNNEYHITELDRKIIKQTQTGLALTPRPFREIARNIGCHENDIIQHLKIMQDNAIIRRIGGVPNHFRLGFKANGMTVWDVPDDRIMELGDKVGELSFVSHSYQRPRHKPLWHYNLFAMVHGHTRDAVDEKIQQIKDILGSHCRANDTLFSTAILKKTGLRLAI